MSAAGVTADARIAGERRRGAARISLAAARVPAFLVLAAFGAYRWADMVDPHAGGAMTAQLAAALAAGLALLAVARRARPRAHRIAAIAVATGGLLVVALRAAGVPTELLRPRGWDDLAAGIAQGLGAVPNIRVPYSGDEVWIATVIVLGGALLVGLAALLAFAPRRRGAVGFPFAAALVLGVLYLVPAMQRDTPNQFLAGGVFTALLVAFLWLERVERRSAPLAAGVVAAALLTALVAGPVLDRETSLIDYETLAQSLSSGPSTRYDWNHDYGPLDWSRDGREVLRVGARRRAYWKAANLAVFDGRRWAQAQGNRQGDLEGEFQAVHRQWRQTLRVTVRALSSAQFVAAGTTLDIPRTPRTPVMTQPGVYSTRGEPLKRGNAYRAVVYVPQPNVRELRAAAQATELPAGTALTGLTTVGLPGGGRAIMPAWGEDADAFTTAALASSPYARAYELARSLRARSVNQYEYMRAIEAHLARDYVYSEDPRSSPVPLADFLFGGRAGYCQQFSGAMALLLRLGGVPARVAAGFSPGAYDAARREYVVRDIDAHSWVEVYFPTIGWVTRDPTPADSPARSQTADIVAGSTDPAGALPDAARPATPGVAPETPAGGGADAAAAADDRSPWRLIGGAVVVVLAALGALLAVRARRRRRRAGPDEHGAWQLAELHTALARSGRPADPPTTLEVLAQRWHGTPAESYVRVLADARYGYGSARPTAAQRAALRRELGLGLGPRGRLRAWWALPPRLPARHRRSRHPERDPAA